MMKIKSRFALKRGVLLDLKISDFGWERGVFLAQNPRKWCIFQAWVRAWYTFWSGVGAGLNCSQYDDDKGVWLRLPIQNFGATTGVFEWTNNFIPHFARHLITHPCWSTRECLLCVLWREVTARYRVYIVARNSSAFQYVHSVINVLAPSVILTHWSWAMHIHMCR